MFNFYSQHPAAHTIYSFTNRFYHWRGNHVFGDPFPNTRQATKVVRETTVLFLTKEKEIAVHVYHTFWYLFIDVHCPRIREKETLVTIYIKEHEKKNPIVHPIPLAKASEDVGCRSRRCTLFFSLILVSLPHLATLWSSSSTQDHIKIHQFFNRMMESTETEALLSRFAVHRNGHFDFRF